MNHAESIVEKIKKGKENAVAIRVEEDGTVTLRTSAGIYLVEKAFIHFKNQDFEFSTVNGTPIEKPFIVLLDEKKEEARCAILNEKAEVLASSASDMFEGLLLIVVLKGNKKFTIKAIWSGSDIGHIAKMLVDNDEASLICNYGLAEMLAKRMD